MSLRTFVCIPECILMLIVRKCALKLDSLDIGASYAYRASKAAGNILSVTLAETFRDIIFVPVHVSHLQCYIDKSV